VTRPRVDYERHGRGYARNRRADPRIEVRLHAALGEAHRRPPARRAAVRCLGRRAWPPARRTELRRRAPPHRLGASRARL